MNNKENSKKTFNKQAFEYDSNIKDSTPENFTNQSLKYYQESIFPHCLIWAVERENY